MHFSSDINRPPYEGMDAYLQITSGCSHRTCAFCTFYKDARFRISPIEEVEADIDELAAYARRWPFDRIYLQGADPFIAPYDYLARVADLVHEKIPQVKSIGGYARVDNVRNKSVDELHKLAQMGYSNFYFGNETGDDYLLERMHKGYKAQEVVDDLGKLDAAGMSYIMNFLGGLGGRDYGLSHAQKSATVINQLHPTMVYASELTLFPDTPLSRDVEKGTFREATEAERMEEMREFVADLTVPTVFKAEHVTIPERIAGRLPEDRDRMLAQLDRLTEQAKAGELDRFRETVMGL